MIGIDITQISRFANKEERFAKKILHPSEMEEFNNSTNKTRFIATRWAIKEALYKVDNSYFEFSKVNIKKSKELYLFKDFSISTSSEQDITIAIVQKEKKCQC
ncbi:MAG: 4'-phosphopantetheinyl transferase superfamily protein [Mycoplasma sp.]|nr:4'-phosphopantetheinyl transferase superfamily protein [Mycoplasma sp.]